MKKAQPRTEEVQRLVHELAVQQLELERQNEEIRNAQHELEAERDRVADLYQLAPVAHLTLDRMGTVVEATVLAVSLLGVDYGRLTRRRLHERVVPADWVTLSRHLLDVFAGAERRTCDLGILTGRDSARLVRVSSVAVPDAGGQSTRCRTVLMDITEHKQAEEGLKDSRAQFESIVTSALDAIVTVGGDGCVVLMNPAAERMFGCKAATAIGHAFDRFIPESSRKWYRAVILADADNDVPSPAPGQLGAMVVRRADGTEIPVEASISEVLGSWGRLFTVILRDVSARQRAERALSDRLRLEQLVTHLAMTFGHLSIVELDLEVQRGLRAVVDFLEVDRGSLIEFSRAGGVARCWAIEDWMGVEDFPWIAARLQRGEFVTVSRLEELPDDAPRDRRSYLTYRVKPQVGLPLEAGGRVVGGLVFSTIGDERATSDDLKQQLHLVGEVFANLLARKVAEVELQKLREDLGHVNRVATIGELTTSLAHELNQPLTAILSCAQAAQRMIAGRARGPRGVPRDARGDRRGRQARRRRDRPAARAPQEGRPRARRPSTSTRRWPRWRGSSGATHWCATSPSGSSWRPRFLPCGATECSCSRCSSTWPSTGWTRCRSCARVSGPSSSRQSGIARGPSGSRFETPGSESAGATWSTCFSRSTRPRLAGWGSD